MISLTVASNLLDQVHKYIVFTRKDVEHEGFDTSHTTSARYV